MQIDIGQFKAHPRLRLLLRPLIAEADGGDGYGWFRMSELDETQLYKNGRTPCGKMNVSPDKPGLIAISEANLIAMGEQGVRCSRQSGELTPDEFKLTEPELDMQAFIYRTGRGLSL